MPALRTAVEMALTAVQSALSSWVISPVPRAFLPSSMTKRVRVTMLVSKVDWSVMLGPAVLLEADRQEGAGRGERSVGGRLGAEPDRPRELPP